MLAVLALLATPAEAGAKDRDQIEALEARVEALETQLQRMQASVNALEAAPKRPSRPEGPDPEVEQAASDLLKDADRAFTKLEYDKAREIIRQVREEYPNSRAARASKRILDDLDIIGKDAGSMEVEMWLQGETSMDSGKATLLVFWEVWCPHCKREVPKLDATYQKYKDQGLNLVGLTKATRDVTIPQIKDFIAENPVSYPIAKEEGAAMSETFGVRGIPAGAVVKDGKVVWRGHPARLTDEMIEMWLE